LRSPPEKFTTKFIRHCAIKYPLLPADLGTEGRQTDGVQELISTVAREKSPFHRFIDDHERLARFFAVVSVLLRPPFGFHTSLFAFISTLQGYNHLTITVEAKT
jgi:hypothetical protein